VAIISNEEAISWTSEMKLAYQSLSTMGGDGADRSAFNENCRGQVREDKKETNKEREREIG
jgi:hypothetical protein